MLSLLLRSARLLGEVPSPDRSPSLLFCVQVDGAGAVVAVVASQVANVFESWLGATSQGKQGREWVRRTGLRPAR